MKKTPLREGNGMEFGINKLYSIKTQALKSDSFKKQAINVATGAYDPAEAAGNTESDSEASIYNIVAEVATSLYGNDTDKHKDKEFFWYFFDVDGDDRAMTDDDIDALAKNDGYISGHDIKKNILRSIKKVDANHVKDKDSIDFADAFKESDENIIKNIVDKYFYNVE